MQEFRKNEDTFTADFTIEELLELDNVVEKLSKQQREEIAQICIDDYESDKNSRADREHRIEEATRLAMQITNPKNEPWEGCANVIVPIISTAVIHFASRAFPAIVKDNKVAIPEIIGKDDGVEIKQIDPQTNQEVITRVGAGEKKAKGERRCSFINWQLLRQMKNWYDDTDKLTHMVPTAGTIVRKTYYKNKKPCTALVLPKNFIVDYYTSDFEKATKSEVMLMETWEIVSCIKSGEFIDFDMYRSSSTADDVKNVIANTMDDNEQLNNSKNLPQVFIEQHRRLDLDNDGYAEPYIAMIHLATKTLVKLRPNFERDRIIYNKKNEIQDIQPEETYTPYHFIPSPDGSFYHLGFGDLLYNINESVNSIINRLLDAGTLASTSSGFISDGIKAASGEISMKMGRFNKVKTRAGALRDNIYQFQFPEPSRTLLELMGILIDMAEKLAFSNKIIDPSEAANMPVGTALQLVEQGLTGFKSVYKRFYRSITKELNLIDRMNQLYLDRDVYIKVIGTDPENDFKNIDFDIVPASDPSAVTDMQRVARAMMVGEYKDDPRVDGVEVIKNVFEAIGADTDLVKGNPPPQADPMMEMQKMLLQVESHKAQIKQMEAQLKAQKDAATMQLEKAKAELKAQNDLLKHELSSKESQMKLASMMAEINMKKIETESSAELKEVEKEKIQAQIMQILADIELKSLGMNEKEEKGSEDEERREDKESKNLNEIKRMVSELMASKNRENETALKALADAIKEKNNRSGKLMIYQDEKGNISWENE